MKLVIFIIFIISCLVVGLFLRKGTDKLLEYVEKKSLNKEQ